MLKQRIITAVVLALALLAALLWLPFWPLLALLGGVVALAAWEWSDLSGLRSVAARLGYCAAIVVLLGLGLHYTRIGAAVDLERVRDAMGLAGIWWSVALLWVKGYPSSAILWGAPPLRLLMGALVLVPAWLALAYLLSLDAGMWGLLFVVGVVAAADIGAFFAGRRWGRRKLAPRVSPGKSWAGFWGGLACALLFGAAAGPLLWPGLGLPALLAIVVATVLASVLGDLLESMVKRHRGIKDSGRCLPGHGGVMDRLDSLSAAAPVFTLGLLLAGAG